MTKKKTNNNEITNNNDIYKKNRQQKGHETSTVTSLQYHNVKIRETD